MKLSIQHTTRYDYSEEVRLNPHILRLRPRSTSRQKVEHYSMEVHPEPVHTVTIDAIDDSLCHRLYFVGYTSYLEIVTQSLVRADPSLVPEDLHLFSTIAILPLIYPDTIFRALMPFLERVDASEVVVEYAQSVAESTRYATDAFLIELARRINREFKQIYREQGWPMDPSDTLRLKEGSCRDLAWLFLACCRYFGIASRFVSGYVFDEVRIGDGGELHAWVEVYLLGYGWVGYDPSYACQAGDRHIKLCAGVVPQLCAPVDGTFMGGPSSKSSLTTRVIIRPAVAGGVI